MKILKTPVAGVQSDLTKLADNNKAVTSQKNKICVVGNKLKSRPNLPVSPNSIISEVIKRQKS